MCFKRCSEPKNTSRDGILCAEKCIFRFIVRFWNKFWPETMAIFTLGEWEKMLRIVLRSVSPVHGGSKAATNRLIHFECGFETNPGRKRCPLLPKKWLPGGLLVSESKNIFI